MKHLNVQMLGDFSFSEGENLISDLQNRTKKVWLLLAFILCKRGQIVSKSGIQGSGAMVVRINDTVLTQDHIDEINAFAELVIVVQLHGILDFVDQRQVGLLIGLLDVGGITHHGDAGEDGQDGDDDDQLHQGEAFVVMDIHRPEPSELFS